MSDWHKVCEWKELQEDEPLGANIDSNPIAVVRLPDGCYAIHDICPHAYALLSTGFVEGEKIYCPLHAASFDVRSGKRLEGPAEQDLRTYPVRVVDGSVYVNLASEAQG